MYMCNHIWPSSVVFYLSGIVQFLEPFFPNICIIHNSTLIHDIIIGCKRLCRVPVSHKSPLTLSILVTIANSLAISYDNFLFQSLLLIGFYALLWLGDLCDPTIRYLQNPAKCAICSFLKFLSQYFTYTLPAHKPNESFKGNVIFICQLWESIPVLSIFCTYIQLHDQFHPFSSPLWFTSAGNVPTWVFFFTCLQVFHFGSSISGQSIRAGDITALATLQVPPHIIQSLGC